MEDFELANKPEEELTIEELSVSEGLAPSILAAVKQFQGWAGGKKVSKTAFKDAVNAFLNAPACGVRR